MQPEINSIRYPRSDISDADGVAWVLTNSEGQLIKYPFKFQSLEDYQVRFKVLYVSICQSDILFGRSKWGTLQYPICPGHEIVGQITKLGALVTTKKVGDIIGVTPLRKCCFDCEYCQQGDTNLCLNKIPLYSPGWFGGYTTHMQVDENWVIPIPPSLPLEKTAPILCAGLTVYTPLKKYLRIGGKCAVLGIGGLGHFALQYANKLGMFVTAFTTRPQRKAQLYALGAENVQHSTNLQQLKKNEGKYDVVLNTLFLQNQDIYRAHQRLTAPGGVYITVGVPTKNIKFSVDYDYLIKNQIKVAGSNVASIQNIKDALNFSAEHNILPIVEEYGFEEVNKAFHRAQFQAPKFRCVINVQQWAKKNGFDK